MDDTRKSTYEKLGVFYLGREVDADSGALSAAPLLYDSKDLTTHAVVVGMTGSGKTGLAISLLEEAAIDRIPVIALDPKGDLGNLLLTFPSLAASDFRPWIDEAAASAAGRSPDEAAEHAATSWREGLAAWDQDGDRIRRLREAADFAIYTPGGSAGLPIAMLRSLDAPPPALRGDDEGMRDRVEATASGLLFLLGLDADPVQSRDHILISTLLDGAWREGRNLDLASLIRSIQTPPFERVGVLDLESFYPAAERFALAMRVNNLLASPGFAAWREGAALDAARLLYGSDGTPRVSVISLAHLDDAQRMFFVTLLLGEVLSWVRAQPGTGSLRAILLMDEVFGFLPPSANPPSKKPLLTLLKQARAFGVGVVLSTQNPMDLDYKALSNAGTWMIGRLQTERDVLRVLDGLEGAAAAGAGAAAFDRGAMQARIAGLGKRRFLLHNVHEQAPALFETRWCMSYLAGPLTRVQIERLMGPRKAAAAGSAPAVGVAAVAGATAGATPGAATPTIAGSTAEATGAAGAGGAADARPVLPPSIQQGFVPGAGAGAAAAGGLLYRPALLGVASLHFVDARAGVDLWEDRALLAPVGDPGADPWEFADGTVLGPKDLIAAPEGAGRFEALPAEAARPASYETWARALSTRLYRDAALTLWKSADPPLSSNPGETEGAFRGRVAQKGREARDLAREKLRARYDAKLASLQERVRKDEQRVEREKSQQGQQAFQTAVSVGATVLGALLGRKAISSGTVGRASTAVRSAGRAVREQEDVRHAGETLESDRAKLAELERELEQELAAIESDVDPTRIALTEAAIKPRKTDLRVSGVWLVWLPWRAEPGGALRPDFKRS